MNCSTTAVDVFFFLSVFKGLTVFIFKTMALGSSGIDRATRNALHDNRIIAQCTDRTEPCLNIERGRWILSQVVAMSVNHTNPICLKRNNQKPNQNE